MALVAHLRGNLVLARCLGHFPSFIHGVRQRFLAIDVFAHFHGQERGRRVHVVRCGHRHRVDALAFLLQQHAEIFEAFRLRIFSEGTGGVDLVHVAQRVDVFVVHVFNVAGAFAAHTYAGDVQPIIRAEHVAAGDEGKG